MVCGTDGGGYMRVSRPRPGLSSLRKQVLDLVGANHALPFVAFAASTHHQTYRPPPPQPKTIAQVGMGTLVLALTLGILARSWLSPRIKLPYTSVVLMLGTCLHCRVPLPFIKEASGRPRQPI